MSFPKKGRDFQPGSGRKFPDEPGYTGFAEVVAAALKAEFGGTAAAVKSVRRLTGANERTARNWLEGKNGPGGDYLIALIRHSDTVLHAILIMADRPDFAVGGDALTLRAQLKALLEAIDDLTPN